MVAVQREMADATRAFADASSSKQVEGIEKIVGKVIEELENSLGRHLKEAGDSLARFADKQAAQLTQFGANLEQLSKTTGQLTEAAQAQEQMFGQARAAGEGLATASAGVLDATLQIAKILDEFKTPVGELKIAAVEVGRLVLAQGQALQQLGEQASELHRGIDLQRTSWDDYLTRLEPLSLELANGLQEFVNSFGPAIDGVLEEFDKELAKAVGRLGTTVDRMRDHTEDFDDRIAGLLGNLRHVTLGMEQAVPKLQAELKAAVTGTTQAIAEVRGQLLREVARNAQRAEAEPRPGGTR